MVLIFCSATWIGWSSRSPSKGNWPSRRWRRWWRWMWWSACSGTSCRTSSRIKAKYETKNLMLCTLSFPNCKFCVCTFEFVYYKIRNYSNFVLWFIQYDSCAFYGKNRKDFRTSNQGSDCVKIMGTGCSIRPTRSFWICKIQELVDHRTLSFELGYKNRFYTFVTFLA